MKTFVQTCSLILLLCIVSGAAVAQRHQADLQTQAEEALTDGRPDQALEIATTLLSDNPANFPALFIMAAAQSDLGQFRQAASTAAQAYRAARTTDEKLQAARLAGSARFRAKQYSRAEWWLRAAANHVSTQQDAIAVFQEFQTIRRQNPISLSVNFGIAPSNNINNGAEENIVELDFGDGDVLPLTFDEPLSGIEYSGDVSLAYNVFQNDVLRASVGGYAYGRTFTLTDDPPDEAPDVTGEDFSLGLVELYLLQEWALFPNVGNSSTQIGYGKLWYGGDPLWDYRKLSFGQEFALSDTAAITVQATRQQQSAIDPQQVDATVDDLQVTYSQTRTNGDRLRVTVAGRNNDSDDIEISYVEYRATVDYTLAQPLFGVNWDFSVGIGHTDYEEFRFTLDGRRDNFALIGATATFSNISYFGFSPSLSVSAQRTESSFDPAELTQYQASLGLRSNF